MNTITIQLHEDDRRALDVLAGKLDTLIQEAKINSDTLEMIRLALTNATIPAAAPAVAADQPEPEAEPTPEEKAPTEPQEAKNAPVVKLADIQKKVVDLSAAGKRDAVKAVIQAYAPRVSAIPEDKLPEVMEKLAGLEG